MPSNQPSAFLVLSNIFDLSLSQLWQSLTWPKAIQQWFFKEIQDFKPIKGFKTAFVFCNENESYTHCWEVLEAVDQQKLTILWHYKECPGQMKVIFELLPKGQGVQLQLCVFILKPFPDKAAFSAPVMERGWCDLIQNRLLNFINQTTF